MARKCPDIDVAIASTLERCVCENKIVTDYNFVQVVRKKYGKEKPLKFYTNGHAVFVLLERFDAVPLVTSILTEDMIDGTVILNVDQEEIKNVFHRWKREAKIRG